MAGSSIFVTYGLKAGGGAPFLRRTRNSFGQAQQKTSTAFTGPQLQARVNNCIVTGSSTSGRLNASHGTSTCFSVTQGYSGSVFYGGSCTSCGSTLRGNAQTTCFGGMQASTFDVICACTTTTFRGRQGFSG